jgi:hypothetical protein
VRYRGTSTITLLLLIAAAANVRAAGLDTSIICQDGDTHHVVLDETAPGTPGAYQGTDVRLGPSKRVWLTLPNGAKLASGQTQPIPVPNLNASRIEVTVSYGGNRTEQARVDVSDSESSGAVATSLILARMEPKSYAVPANCRVMSVYETQNYAEALLNNAGCLLPARLHTALDAIPGAGGRMIRGCGWSTDVRLAMHALQKSADLGSRDAGWILAQMELGAVDPELANHREALVQLSRTAGLGHASADLMEGIMRWRGDGMPTTPDAAFNTLLPHARQGSREAQGIIGTMYLTGQGVPVNRVQAYAWCHLAAAAAPLMYSDPIACRDAAEHDMTFEEVLDARDLAVEIHHRQY